MEVSSTNTYIFDAESPTELARLINQDRVITQAMGGPLSGVPTTFPLHNILDLGCGPGGWVLDVAFTRPDAEIEGIDASRAMVDYANARARTQRLPNASFGVMDMTHPFEIPDHSFELVNARFLAAVLKREVWPSFLGECTRVLRPGGFLRLTEAVDFGATTSEAVNQLMELTRHALYQLGYGFSGDHALNLLPMLLSFFRQREYQHVQVKASALDYSAKTDAWADTYHNVDIIGVQMKPLLVKLGLISEELFAILHQQALIDMQTDAFCGIGHVTTMVGQKPPKCG
jgi:ubiquinone/menaquinone biosynthesis C-methylase UbiE